MGEMLLSMGRGGGDGLCAQVASVPGLQMLLLTQVGLQLPRCALALRCTALQPAAPAALLRCRAVLLGPRAEQARAASALLQLRVLQQQPRESLVGAFHQVCYSNEVRWQQQQRQQQEQAWQQGQQREQQREPESEQQRELRRQLEQLPEHVRGLGFSALVLLQAGYTAQLKLGELA